MAHPAADPNLNAKQNADTGGLNKSCHGPNTKLFSPLVMQEVRQAKPSAKATSRYV